MFIYAAPAIGSFLSSTFTLGYNVTSSGALAAITVTRARIAAVGVAAAIGLGIIMFSKNNPCMSNKPPVSWTDIDEGLEVFEKVGRDLSKAAAYLLDQFYGKGNWTHDYKYGFNALRKWFDRIIRNWPRKGS